MSDRKRQKYSWAKRATTQVTSSPESIFSTPPPPPDISRSINPRMLIRSRVRGSVRRGADSAIVEVASPRLSQLCLCPTSSSSGIEPDLSGGTLDLVVHRLLYSRATPYSTWQDDFSYDKYSDRAAVHSRCSAADANNTTAARRRR